MSCLSRDSPTNRGYDAKSSQARALTIGDLGHPCTYLLSAHNILPPSQQRCVPFVGEEQQDSSRTAPTSDCNHGETRAFRLGETPGPSGPDARMHAAHLFHVVNCEAFLGPEIY